MNYGFGLKNQEYYAWVPINWLSIRGIEVENAKNSCWSACKNLEAKETVQCSQGAPEVDSAKKFKTWLFYQVKVDGYNHYPLHIKISKSTFLRHAQRTMLLLAVFYMDLHKFRSFFLFLF